VGAPVWSPDGRRVIYKQQASLAGPGSIWSVSADGQNHRKLKDLSRADLSSGLSLSPDGNTLLYTDSKPEDQYSIRSLNLKTMTWRTLTTPPSNHWGDWDPRFSPDGGTIAFKRVKDFWQDYIYTMPAGGGSAALPTR
jgi:Tol biopolymer transport system component